MRSDVIKEGLAVEIKELIIISIDTYATDLINGIWIEEEAALILNLEWKK